MRAVSRESWRGSSAVIDLLLSAIVTAGCPTEELVRAREDPSGIVVYVTDTASCATRALVDSDVASYIEIYIDGATQPVAVRRRLSRD